MWRRWFLWFHDIWQLWGCGQCCHLEAFKLPIYKNNALYKYSHQICIQNTMQLSILPFPLYLTKLPPQKKNIEKCHLSCNIETVSKWLMFTMEWPVWPQYLMRLNLSKAQPVTQCQRPNLSHSVKGQTFHTCSCRVIEIHMYYNQLEMYHLAMVDQIRLKTLSIV